MMEGIVRAACAYLGQPYSEIDCQALVEHALRDCGINKNLAGSNAWFRFVKSNGWVGTPEECKSKYGKIPVGSFLFILKHDNGEPEKYKPDEIGNASHIGIYTGMTGKEMCAIASEDGVQNASAYNYGDGAIHSSASRGCVCTSNFKGKTIKGGWNMVGVWDNEDGDDNSVVSKATVHSENGGSVKLRASPSTSCKLYWDIPNGTIVDLLDWGDKWSKIRTGDLTGYMMSQFLVRGEIVPGEPDADMITVSKTKLMALYDNLGEILFGGGVG